MGAFATRRTAWIELLALHGRKGASYAALPVALTVLDLPFEA